MTKKMKKTARDSHKDNLADYISKLKKAEEISLFSSIQTAYEDYRSVFSQPHDFSDDDVKSIVDALNRYRQVAVPVFDNLPNSGQKALGYTIMEEFFCMFFSAYMSHIGVNHQNLFLGKGNSYVSLSFTPKSFNDVFTNVAPYMHTKDQDFVLGVSMSICVSSGESPQLTTNTVLPIVAIECKTYLERNMLDSCANTASRLKRAMPYCIYIVAAEYMKMEEASPELTDIDEVYILCRAKNSVREERKKAQLPPLDIDYKLVIDLLRRVETHLGKVWWSPDDAVSNGKIIRRP